VKHSKGAPVFTEEQIRNHAAKAGVPLPAEFTKDLQPYQVAIVNHFAGVVPKERQNKTEKAFGLILEARKRRGEVIEYKPFGIRLEWGAHPDTGKPQVYSPDYTVWEVAAVFLKVVECKGPHIFPKDLIRFRGCRAEWGMWFRFEMWQKDKAGVWRRIE
jgi:hypothetical protein